LTTASESVRGDDGEEVLEVSALVDTATSVEDKILAKCTRAEILPFCDLFSQDTLLATKKVGEGSYGEVFMLPPSDGEDGYPVLKLVPVDGDARVNGDAQTLLEDMLAEVAVSTALSRVSQSGQAVNFVQILQCFLVQGQYPPELLQHWDDYDQRKGSENDRPDAELVRESTGYGSPGLTSSTFSCPRIKSSWRWCTATEGQIWRRLV